MFTRFGGVPDVRVRTQLARGARIRAILAQPQHAPLRLADEVALVLAVQSGMLDALPVPDVAAFRRGLARRARPRRAGGRAHDRTEPAPWTKRQAHDLQALICTCRPRHRRTPARRTKAMTERLAEITARHRGHSAARPVVNAMRGIAAARAQEGARAARRRRQLRRHRSPPRSARAVALRRRPRPDAGGRAHRPALVLFCAEQGFAGAFSDRVLDAAGDANRAELFLIGTRGAAVGDRAWSCPRWRSAMPAHSLGHPEARRPHRRRALRGASPRARSAGWTLSSAWPQRAAASRWRASACSRST